RPATATWLRRATTSSTSAAGSSATRGIRPACSPSARGTSTTFSSPAQPVPDVLRIRPRGPRVAPGRPGSVAAFRSDRAGLRGSRGACERGVFRVTIPPRSGLRQCAETGVGDLLIRKEKRLFLINTNGVQPPFISL
ncbi:MAG: hypothetical protein RIS64_3156, partial [Bacteroidota bacterium]